MGVAVGSTSMDELLSWAGQFLCVWLVGLVLGWLLPKPKWVQRGLSARTLLLTSPPGLWVRRGLLAAHAAVIVREVWRNLFAPGTFRGVVRNLVRTASTGERFEWPRPGVVAVAVAAAPSGPLVVAAIETAIADTAAPPAEQPDTWYVGEKDLAEFKWTIEENGRPAGASDWEPMMEKTWPGCVYTAWRRTLPSGKSEYKSITVSEDATAEEFMDFYLDDEARMGWDSMITETQLLECGSDPARRQQVVYWLRTFPFAFIQQREYIIARRFFRGDDGSLYALTKGLVDHPAAPQVPGRVRMEGFHSHWRSRTVASPFGTGKPAVETVLLHFEDFRINERLARFAVRHGMAGFVKGMIPAVERFVSARRARCGPEEEDLSSFGRRQLVAPSALPSPTPTPRDVSRADLARAASAVSNTSSVSGYSVEDSASERSVRGEGMQRAQSLRRLGTMMLASGVAIALARTASAPPLPAGPSGRYGSKRYSGSSSHHGKNHGSHRHHSGGHVRRGDGAPPRPRRRQQELAEVAEAGPN